MTSPNAPTPHPPAPGTTAAVDPRPHRARDLSPRDHSPRDLSPCDATVVITTKNRKDELRVALASAFAQTVPLDVVVIDDGSTDGTSDLVRAEFPAARLFTMPQSGGLIRRRNQGAAAARGRIIFSIDDDAEFSTPRVVEQTLADFDHPRIGAVAIPFCDVRKGSVINQRAPDPTGHHLGGLFIGTAHALRRDLFLSLGGYRAELIHQGEEYDYIVRMLAAGYVIRLGRSDIINHYESPKRDLTRMTYYGRRNDILFGWCNLRLPDFAVYLPAVLFSSSCHAWRNNYFAANLKGIFNGFRAIPEFRADRRPIDSSIFWLSRRLRRRTHTLAEIEPFLPPARPIPPAPAPLDHLDAPNPA